MLTCSTTQGMLGEKLFCLKMAHFLSIFTASEHDDCETIICPIFDSKGDVILLAAVTCYMRRDLNGYFEVTIPAYLSGEFENHLRMTTETCQLLTQDMMHTGRIPSGNSSGRPASLPKNKYCCSFGVWQTGNRIARSTTSLANGTQNFR